MAGGWLFIPLHYYLCSPFCQPHHLNAYKKTYGYQERDEQQREEFIAQIEQMEPEGLVYLDEAGINSQDSDYPYGYCEEGQRFHALKSGKRQGRVSYMAAWCYQQLLQPLHKTQSTV